MGGKTDQLEGKAEASAGDATGDREPKREGQIDQLAGKTKIALGEAADWAADRLKDVSERLSRPAGDDSKDDRPEVAHRPPAPTTGDAGARAAGKVEDDIT